MSGIVEDLSGDIRDVLGERGVNFVTFDEWSKVDSIEKEVGKAKGKPREKILDYDEMFKSLK
jgi:hypothetical protein